MTDLVFVKSIKNYRRSQGPSTLYLNPGVNKVPYNLIFFSTPISFNLDFLPKNLRPLPDIIIFPIASILRGR